MEASMLFLPRIEVVHWVKFVGGIEL
jgi:hypothetical protein